jgi:hypothetical protein
MAYIRFQQEFELMITAKVLLPILGLFELVTLKHGMKVPTTQL